MSSHPGKVWTYDDYAALPDDGKRHEVIEGELEIDVATLLSAGL
jgi:hypothetical protein